MLPLRVVLALVIWGPSSADHPAPSVASVQVRSILRRLTPSVVLQASPQRVGGVEPAMVSLRWSGLPSSMRDGWVGLYLAGEDPTAVVPIKYKFCNSSKGGEFGAGSLAFLVHNFRAGFMFRLFVGWKTPVLVAESGVIVTESTDVPTGVRLALTSQPGEMRVSWTSAPLPAGVQAQLRYQVLAAATGRAPMLRATATLPAASSAYGRESLCGAPANAEGFRDPGTFYSVVIAGLQPGDRVLYTVGSSAAWSQEFSFRAAPAPGAPVRLLLTGDLGQDPGDASAQPDFFPWYSQSYAWADPGAHNTTRAMLADHRGTPADAVLHNGDLSYAMGYSSIWDVFHDTIEPLSAQVPWMVTIGNHERDWPESGSAVGHTDSYGECGVPALLRFPMPYASDRLPPLDEPWYTLPLGCVLVIAISTEHDMSPGSRQHTFLAQALRDVDRSVTPWVVLEGHRPYYISSSWDGDEDFARSYREAVGDLVEQDVDVILGAHHHSYQRTCRLRRGRCVEDGLLNLIIGMGGAKFCTANSTKPAIFDVVDDQNFGYARMIANSTTLIVEFVHGDDQEVYDRVELRKGAAGLEAGSSSRSAPSFDEPPRALFA